MEENNVEENDEELSMEDVVEENDVVLNALVDVLIQKGVVSEEELQRKMEELDGEDEDDEESSEDAPGAGV